MYPLNLTGRLSAIAKGYPLQTALRVHEGDMRTGAVKEPYLNHLLRVAIMAREMGEDVPSPSSPVLDDIPPAYGATPEARFLTVLEVTGLLHDAHEDHPDRFTLEEMARQLPSPVAAALRRLSAPPRDKRGPGWYTRYLLAIHADPIARLVKLADLQDNLRDIHRGSLRDKYEAAAYILSLPGPLPPRLRQTASPFTISEQKHT